MKLILSLLVILFIVDTCSGQSQNDCVFSDWKESFSTEGWSYCNPGNYWLTGLWRLTNRALVSLLVSSRSVVNLLSQRNGITEKLLGKQCLISKLVVNRVAKMYLDTADKGLKKTYSNVTCDERMKLIC